MPPLSCMMALALAGGLILCLGCGPSRELQDTRLTADECQLQLEAALKELQNCRQDARYKAQRDRLAAENLHLKKQLDDLRQAQNLLRNQLATLQDDQKKNADTLAAERTELQQAMLNLTRSRQKWEQMLADRQKQIDLLTNQIERLKEQR